MLVFLLWYYNFIITRCIYLFIYLINLFINVLYLINVLSEFVILSVSCRMARVCHNGMTILGETLLLAAK
jgi:hypothetical protein